MSSLTQVAYSSRRLIKYGGSGLLVFIIVWTLSVAGIRAYLRAHPPYVAPTTKYGILPKNVFPQKNFSKKNFSLELPNDSIPKFGDQAKVYVIYRPENTFLALDYDSKIAESYGFKLKPTEIKSGIYEFKKEGSEQKLTMNVIEGSFKLEYPYTNDQEISTKSSAPLKDEAIEIAKSFLKKGNKSPTDIEGGNQKVSYWKVEYDGLKPVTSATDAQVARVDFFRKKLDGDLEIVPADYIQAPISVMVSGLKDENRQVVEANYKYSNIDRESFSTYPIKTPEEAFNELKSGNYWPAIDSKKESVTLRRISLAYFEPVTLTNYLQPVYVFNSGDNDMVVYVPAIKSKWIK